jgi:hypothetical protein
MLLEHGKILPRFYEVEIFIQVLGRKVIRSTRHVSHAYMLIKQF